MSIPAKGDCGHLLGEDEPLVVISLCGDGRLRVTDDRGGIFPTYATCFVAETASLDPTRVRLALRRSRLLAFV